MTIVSAFFVHFDLKKSILNRFKQTKQQISGFKNRMSCLMSWAQTWVDQWRSHHDPKTDAKQHNLDLNISIRIFDTEICRYYWAFAKSPALLLCKLLIRQWDWIGLGILPNQFSKLSTFWTSKLHCWKIEHQWNQVPFQHSLFFAFSDKTLHGPMRDGTKMWFGSSYFLCTFLPFVRVSEIMSCEQSAIFFQILLILPKLCILRSKNLKIVSIREYGEKKLFL